MRKLLALYLSLILIAQLPATTVFASFDDQGTGARSPGMADAFTAVADDADAMGTNPAGLIQMNEGQISTQYGQLAKGLGDGSTLGTTYLGYAHPLLRGFRTLGISYFNFKADSLLSERTITLSYGQRINFDPFGFGGIWSGGFNVKQLHRQFETDRFSQNALNDAGVGSHTADPLFASGSSKDTYAADVGGLVQFGPNYQYTAGAAVINLNQPDVSLGGDGDRAPRSIRAAAAYRPQWGTLTMESRQTKRLQGQTDTDLLFGAERNLPLASLGGIIMRGGYATGSRGFRNITLGFSYLYSRFRLDYAFAFPISALSGTQGTHRLGFSFKMGASPEPQLAKDYSNADLLAAFTWDSLTTHILLTRISNGRGFTPEEKDELMLLLMRRYALDDEGLKDVRDDLRDLIRRAAVETTDWPSLKHALTKGLSTEDQINSGQALELLVKGDAKGALARLALLTVPLQRNDRASAIAITALSELAAQAYRRKDLDSCIDSVRRMMEIMPTDEVVLRAYRQLLSERSSISEKYEPTSTLKVPEVQEAPATLVAPHATTAEKSAAPAPSSFEELVRAYGNSLGYYLERKAANASAEERLTLLQQMRATYGSTKLDLSLVDSELADLQKTAKPVAAPVVTPAAKAVAAPVKVTPAVKPVTLVKKAPAKPKAAPKHAVSPITAAMPKELERAWVYYHHVSAREISDYERIELLQEMQRQFGEQDGEHISRELNRIKKRVQ